MADIRKESEMTSKPKREGEDRILTVPNAITFVRLLLIPVFFIMYGWSDYKIAAVVIFIVAACTDWVDGFVARRTNSVTKIGKTLDPFADRLLIIFGIIAVYVVGRVPLWMMIIVFLRDLVLLSLTAWLDKEHGEKLVVAYIGKIATWFVMTSFALLLLGWPSIPGPGWFDHPWFPGFGGGEAMIGIYLLYLGIILQWITAFVYLYRGIRFGTTKKQVNVKQAKVRE